MALKDQYPQLYSDWVAAGGIDDNFRAHVIATNPSGFKPTSDDVAFIINHANGAFGQATLGLTHFNGAKPAIAYKAVIVGQSPG